MEDAFVYFVDAGAVVDHFVVVDVDVVFLLDLQRGVGVELE